MRTLSLMEQGLEVELDGELLLVRREGSPIDRVRLADVEQVLVFGNVALAPSATAALLRRGIDTVILTPRGRYLGRLMSHAGGNVQLRLRQLERFRNPETCLAIARRVVWGKVTNQRNLLLRGQREQKRNDLGRSIGSLRQLLGAVETAPDLDVLRGLEGQAAVPPPTPRSAERRPELRLHAPRLPHRALRPADRPRPHARVLSRTGTRPALTRPRHLGGVPPPGRRLPHAADGEPPPARPRGLRGGWPGRGRHLVRAGDRGRRGLRDSTGRLAVGH